MGGVELFCDFHIGGVSYSLWAVDSVISYMMIGLRVTGRSSRKVERIDWRVDGDEGSVACLGDPSTQLLGLTMGDLDELL